MSNYTIENLIPVSAGDGRVPAIRIGNEVFPIQISGGGSGWIDVSDTTAEAANVQSGYYFYNSAGVKTMGTLTVSAGIDVSDTTATAGMVLSGAVFHDSTGALVSGAISILSEQTITPTTSNQVLNAGKYLGGSQTILGDSALVSSNIISGASIFGVSGLSTVVDVASTTVTETEVLSGGIFYGSDGIVSSGAIPVVAGGSTIIPGTEEQLIVSSGGGFVDDFLAVAGDSNLVDSNILSGVSIFGVSGTHQCAGGVYLCTSASDPVYYTILGDTYGGNYYRDGDYTDSNKTTPVYTNGTYYYMMRGDLLYGASSFALFNSRNNDSQYRIITSLPPWITAQTTSSGYGGKRLMLIPGRLDSGTWNGREMSVNSSGYYEPAASETYGLEYSVIVPQSGQMYTADALQHIADIWNFDYKRDIAALTSSYQNAMRPDQTIYPDGTITGPDESGWFTFGDVSLTYSGMGEYGEGGTPFSAKTNCFTLAFKFKPVSMGSHLNYNWIASIPNIVAIGIDRDNATAPGALVVGINASTAKYEDTGLNSSSRIFTNFTFTAGEEYDIVICCDGTYCSIIIDGVRVVRLICKEQADVTVTLHQGWDGSWDGCVYKYKDLSLWGRVMTEMAISSSALPIPPVSNIGSSGALPPGATIESVVLSGWQRLTVAGTVMSAVISSSYVTNIGLTVMPGGVISSVTVDYPGRMEVYAGGSAFNVVENGGYVAVYDGATASFQSNTFSGTSYGDSASLTVHSGTTANSITLGWNTAKMFIYNGGSASSVLVSMGQLHMSGGSANAVTVSSGGTAYVSSGGVAGGVTVTYGGTLVVPPGGTVSGVTVRSNGSMHVDGYATHVTSETNAIITGGGTIIYNS